MKHKTLGCLVVDSLDFVKPVSMRTYFRALLMALWKDGENFSAKKPLGNSDWQSGVYESMVKKGFIEGELNEYDELIKADYKKADELILEYIKKL